MQPQSGGFRERDSSIDFLRLTRQSWPLFIPAQVVHAIRELLPLGLRCHHDLQVGGSTQEWWNSHLGNQFSQSSPVGARVTGRLKIGNWLQDPWEGEEQWGADPGILISFQAEFIKFLELEIPLFSCLVICHIALLDGPRLLNFPVKHLRLSICLGVICCSNPMCHPIFLKKGGHGSVAEVTPLVIDKHFWDTKPAENVGLKKVHYYLGIIGFGGNGFYPF
ncbi:hypothetical protein CR513_07766, partial [Mucuna pruriens]